MERSLSLRFEDNNRAPLLSVHNPSKDLIGYPPVPIAGQRLLEAGRVLNIPWDGREDFLEEAEGHLQEPLLLGGILFSSVNQIVHVDGNVMQPIRGNHRGGGGVVGLICWKLN